MKSVIIIAGPTAVGKTSLALQIAKHFDTEIISADSRQCYKELNIGVARPSPEQLAEVKHHFIASHSIHEKVTAVTFERYALEKAEEIFRTKNYVVMVGGTGLYITAFCEGLDEIPEVDEEIRNEIVVNYYQYGLNWLQSEIKKTDPVFYEKGETQNPQRVMRALEVARATGRSILDYRKGKKLKRDFDITKIALQLPKEQLHQNINSRVDKMIEQGLLEEVHSLIPYQHLNALQTVGYKELFSYFSGALTLPEAVELIKKNTQQYAKRQLTWFRKDKEYKWFDAREVKKIKEHLNDALDYDRGWY
ncbi:MAG: tRNA (adenosine(37)-N6)-dimethylallyltransferase MiaA [Chitinophagaceae bacterium]|nr:tRNA (adenosine(37)-N6)-dimethylallyltransferase MiaA [Chitinophagaceae bacterium]